MEYNLYAMGIRHGKERLVDLKKEAEAIGKQYGSDAQMEFEMGIAASIPIYSQTSTKELTIEDLDNSSSSYGMPNERNNSYFGCQGTSHQFVEKDGKIVYNERTGRKK